MFKSLKNLKKSRRNSIIVVWFSLALCIVMWIGIVSFILLVLYRCSNVQEEACPTKTSVSMVFRSNQPISIVNAREPAPIRVGTEFSFPEKVIECTISFEDQVNQWINDICKDYPNVDPYLVQSVIWQESRYFPDAKNYDGSCIGLMQISTRWHKDRAKSLGVDNLMDPYGNVLVGINLLSELISMSHGDVAYALMMYNSGIAEANRLHDSGRVTTYAQTVIHRWQELKEGTYV